MAANYRRNYWLFGFKFRPSYVKFMSISGESLLISRGLAKVFISLGLLIAYSLNFCLCKLKFSEQGRLVCSKIIMPKNISELFSSIIF